MMSAVSILQILRGHTSDVISCDFFENLLATCSTDKTIRVWFHRSDDQFIEKPFSPLLDHAYGVNCVRFSPFGTVLASCSTDGRVILWNIQDGEKFAEMHHLKGSPVRACSFSPTSALLATGGDDEKVVLWDVTTKSVIRVLEGHESMITALSFTPDSAFLLSCSTAGDVMLWDARYGHGKCLAAVANAHDLGILCCDASPRHESVSESGFLTGNYTLATGGNDDLVSVWSVEACAAKKISLILRLKGHTGNVMACRFSCDGSLLVSGGGDRNVIIWNPETGAIIQKVEGHSRYITCCAFSDAFLLATGSNDKTVAVWRLDKDSFPLSGVAPAERGVVLSKRSFLSWDTGDVARWLESLKLETFVETFRANAIDGKELMHLNHDALQTFMKIDSLGHRNKILRGIRCLRNPLWQHVESDAEDELALSEFCCPITHEVMRHPVVAADGYTYEKHAIEEWMESGQMSSPMTNEALPHQLLIPNLVLAQVMKKYQL